MATPINDAYDEAAAAGVRRVNSDGESVEMAPLDEIQRAADRELKKQATSKGRLGIKMFRTRSGGAAPQ